MPAVVVRSAPGGPALDGRSVKRRAERMLEHLGLRGAELSVVLTDDARILVLNREHRRKPKATDVLAFPMDGEGTGPSGATHLLGDVVISLDTAARQAGTRRHDLLAEVTHLLAHGLLHLLGHDHRTEAEERRMNAAAQALILAAHARPSAPRPRALSKPLRDRG